jgi:hypothetical protein
VAGDGALGRVHGAAVPVTGRAIGHAVAGDVGGEVPRADRVLGGDGRARRRRRREHLGRRQRAARQRRPVDLAVEVPCRTQPPVLDRPADGAEKEVAGRGHGRPEDGGDADRWLAARRMIGERRLPQRGRARHQIHRRGDVVPAPGGQGRAGGDLGLTDQDRQRTGVVEQEGEAGAAVLRPRAHDDLPPGCRLHRHARGLDERLQREARELAKGLGGPDDRVRAGVDEPGHACVLAVDRRGDTDGLEVPGAGVAADQPDDLGAIAARPVEGADHEPDLLARRHAERIRVAEHAWHRHAHGAVSLFGERRQRPPGDSLPPDAERVPLGLLEAREHEVGEEPRRPAVRLLLGEHPLGVRARAYEQQVLAVARAAQHVQHGLQLRAVRTEGPPLELEREVGAPGVDREHDGTLTIALPAGQA